MQIVSSCIIKTLLKAGSRLSPLFTQKKIFLKKKCQMAYCNRETSDVTHNRKCKFNHTKHREAQLQVLRSSNMMLKCYVSSFCKICLRHNCVLSQSECERKVNLQWSVVFLRCPTLKTRNMKLHLHFQGKCFACPLKEESMLL